jgi:hypothetical protein
MPPQATARGSKISEGVLKTMSDFLSAQRQDDGFDKCTLRRLGSSQSLEGIDRDRPDLLYLDNLLARRDYSSQRDPKGSGEPCGTRIRGSSDSCFDRMLRPQPLRRGPGEHCG